MSAQRPLSSTDPPRTTLRLIAAFLLGIALGAGGRAPRDRAHDRCLPAARDGPDVLARQVAHGGGVRGAVRAMASVRNCGWALRRRRHSVVSSLANRSCGEIAWTPDGTRVAFVIDGSEMAIYDAQTSKLAGTVRLLTRKPP